MGVGETPDRGSMNAYVPILHWWRVKRPGNMCEFEEIRKYVWPFTMVYMQKQILRNKKIKKTFVPKIMLHKNTS